MKKISVFFFVFVFSAQMYSQDALYTISFVSNWNSITHPINFPPASHWSRLAGATHNASVKFWEIGGLASKGVEEVAENGIVTFIQQEVQAEISNGDAKDFLLYDLGFGDEFHHSNVPLFLDFPYISLMTMLAPSPDWLAEVSAIRLTDESNNWKALVTVPVYTTDSGTDSGISYTSADQDTNPPQNIHTLQGIPPFSNEIIGTFIFTLNEVLSTNTEELSKSISLYPNPANDFINISGPADVVFDSVEIYSVLGKKIKSFNSEELKKGLRVSNVQPGFYFLKVTVNKQTISKRFVIE